MLGEVAARELAAGTRVVAANDHWLAVVPFWAAWPFEVLLIARDPVAQIAQLSDVARDALAAAMHGYGKHCLTRKLARNKDCVDCMRG